MIVSFQGIDSTYFRFEFDCLKRITRSQEQGVFVETANLLLPATVHNTVLHLLQIGTCYKRIQLYLCAHSLITRLIRDSKQVDHGTIRNSVNDNINRHLCSFYKYVINLEERNNKAVASTSPADAFSLQQLCANECGVTA